MTKKKKIVIAFTGSNGVGKTLASNYLVRKHGFTKIDIMEKVEEFAHKLMSDDELGDDKVDQVLMQLRAKGTKINKGYWVNLALTSAARDHNKIVIDGLFPEEIIPYLLTYQIVRPNYTQKVTPNINIIENNSTIKAFKSKVDSIISSL